jgi:hypothetical protein
MNKIIRLKVYDEYVTPVPDENIFRSDSIFINIDHIITFTKYKDFTNIKLSNNCEVNVIETPNEIIHLMGEE